MRIPALLATLCALVALAPPAVAHHAHSPCGNSLTVVGGLVHVDVWRGECLGAAVSFREDLVICDGTDIHALYVHVFILYDAGCQTGVIVERVHIEAAAPVLP